MADRGDYRSIYCAFWDDPDVHALNHLEYRVLTTLKGTLPASGIGIVYPSQLADRCATSTADVEHALARLAEPLAGKTMGWIVRERNIAWIVNALRFEPTLTATNPKHRTYLSKRLLAPLGDSKAILVAFRAHYPEWFSDAKAKGIDTQSHTLSKGTRKPSDRVSRGKRKGIKSRKGIDRVSNHSPILSLPTQSLPNQTKNIPSADAAGDADATESAGPPAEPAATSPRDTWMTPFADAWRERYDGDMAIKAAVKPFRDLVEEWGAPEVLRRWVIYLTSTDGAYANPAKFAQTFGEWNTAKKPRTGGVFPAPIVAQAEILWRRYREHGLMRRLPRQEWDRIGDELAMAGQYLSRDAFLAELRVTKPWELADARTDAWAIDRIAERLQASAAESSALTGAA